MKTLKNTQNENKTQTRVSKLFQAVMILAMLFIASDIYAQNQEVEFDVYTNSAAKASQYLLGDDVAFRDCASVQCEKLTKKLGNSNISCECYHAGITKKNREKIQQNWIDNSTNIIVATIAFGMGIDKPNVRFVIHYNLPLSIEGYYQEIGRAGRDGLESDCILFYNIQDKIIYQKMIANDLNNSIKKNQHNKERLNKLLEIVSFVENVSRI